jgi:hypothetical protein
LHVIRNQSRLAKVLSFNQSKSQGSLQQQVKKKPPPRPPPPKFVLPPKSQVIYNNLFICFTILHKLNKYVFVLFYKFSLKKKCQKYTR